MAVPTNTSQAHNVKTLKEDISDTVDKVSPTETPFYSAVGKGTAKQIYHEWTQVELDAASDSNEVVDGADPDTDAANNGVRLANYTQLSDKVAQVSSSTEASEGVGDIHTIAQQVILKGQALKRDMEKQMLSNKAASPGSDSTPRRSASLISFLRTNASRGTGGAAPTLSGTSTGYPNAAPTDGTQRTFTEALFKAVLQSIWTNGGNAKLAFMGATQKQTASTFTGNATRYKEAEDKKLVAAVDVYVSDFGQVQLVPSRHIRPRDVVIVDPKMVSVDFLQKMNQKPLAKTGHSEKRMVAVEYTLKVRNELAHGHVADLS
ncbi:DUF5309 domain-containing protein [Azospirillum soli]|uniref:DUF5309 domain-containing protein n=1 Tax=Azospirillum soli TaxID=1304799 RepID=UPI001AE9DF31|nr:DUF5309 domain-containing protein [Azospirillum soli]MBP2311889.1 hypothetical protein [Azospirillum soli]